jgi:hypothetical protein
MARNAVTWSAVVQSAEQHDLLVDLRVEGLGATQMSLQTRDPAGKGTGLGVLGCRRIPGEGVHGNLPLFRGLVSVRALLKVGSFFDSASMILEELRGPRPCLIVRDKESDDFCATAALLVGSVGEKTSPPPPRGLARRRSGTGSRGP